MSGKEQDEPFQHAGYASHTRIPRRRARQSGDVVRRGRRGGVGDPDSNPILSLHQPHTASIFEMNGIETHDSGFGMAFPTWTGLCLDAPALFMA